MYLARRDVSHRASPIIGRGTLGVHLPNIVVELSMILRLLILGCWRIATSLHGLVTILRLSPKLLLPIGLLPVGLLTVTCLGLAVTLLILLWFAAAATAARYQVLYL